MRDGNGTTSQGIITGYEAIKDLWDTGGSNFWWGNVDNAGEASFARICAKNISGSSTIWNYTTLTSNARIKLRQGFSTTSGQWEIDITFDELHAYGYTYDSDSVSNAPLGYIDGVSQTITVVATPIGTRTADSNDNDFYLSDVGNGTRTMNGTLSHFSLWDVILTANQISSLSNGVHPFVIDPDNLVLLIELWGNEDPEPNYGVSGDQTKTCNVSNFAQFKPNPPVELIENYL